MKSIAKKMAAWALAFSCLFCVGFQFQSGHHFYAVRQMRLNGAPLPFPFGSVGTLIDTDVGTPTYKDCDVIAGPFDSQIDAGRWILGPGGYRL